MENEELRMERPPESIPEPNVPSLEETLLGRERKSRMNEMSSLVESTGPQDLAWLEATQHQIARKLQAIEGADATQEEARE